jgi:chromosome partitioning protein
MSVITFSSLKGGVGKTSLSVNVAHAFARRDCRTLLIDFDPSGHTTRLFRRSFDQEVTSSEQRDKAVTALVGALIGEESGNDVSSAVKYATKIRDNLSLLPGGNALRHALVGRGAKTFTRRFPLFVQELRFHFDHLIIDTSPDFSVLTRNALAVSDLSVVPVDASEMSIHSLEELIQTAQHIRRPTWCVLRTMVNKRAQRSQAMSTTRLHERVKLQNAVPAEEVVVPRYDIENPYEFMKMLQQWERENVRADEREKPAERAPIYLLRSLVYRSEQQNQLTFAGLTAFDSRLSGSLADQYLTVARELETLLDEDGDSGLEPMDDENSETKNVFEDAAIESTRESRA